MEAVKYRKNPVEVDVIEFTGGAENGVGIAQWINEHGYPAVWFEELPERTNAEGEVVREKNPEHLGIQTPEGELRANVGDFVVRSPEFDFSICKPAVFAKTYSAVEV